MQTIYIIDHGLSLKKRSDRIVVRKGDKIDQEIPILDIKRVVIFGNNQISTDLLRHFAHKGIEVAFLSGHGKFQFRVVPETSKNIYLRMAQHRFYNNPELRRDWARRIVAAKITNQRNMLIRYRRNQPEIGIQKEIHSLKNLMVDLENKKNIDEIMGIEGFASKEYFRAFGGLILGPFRFEKRLYYPPPDPVNALLSFGYMLLFNEINGLLEACGYDVFLGFLHSTKYGRQSLSSDLIEELRSPIVDRLVLFLMNNDVIKPNQFVPVGEKGLKMNDKASKSYLSNYERYMTTDFIDVRTREKTNFRKIVKKNIMQLEHMLIGDKEYHPYVFYS